MKKILIFAAVGLLCLACIGGYASYDSMFPMAEPAECPEADDVVSASAFQNEGPPVALETDDLEKLLQGIGSAEPTRRLSVNDYPAAEAYCTVELETRERLCRYFIYTEGSQLYVEIPSEGIYIISQQTYDIITDCFNS